jgi:DNA-binding transcriptional regulator YiaG
MKIELLPLHDLIRKVRTDLGESQPTFGRRFDLPGQTICRWEKGNRQASYAVLEWCIAYALDAEKD